MTTRDHCWHLGPRRTLAYDGILYHFDDTVSGLSAWMARRLRIIPDRLRSLVCRFHIDVTTENNCTLSCEQSRHGGTITPSVTNSTNAGDEDDFVRKIKYGHLGVFSPNNWERRTRPVDAVMASGRVQYCCHEDGDLI